MALVANMPATVFWVPKRAAFCDSAKNGTRSEGCNALTASFAAIKAETKAVEKGDV